MMVALETKNKEQFVMVVFHALLSTILSTMPGVAATHGHGLAHTLYECFNRTVCHVDGHCSRDMDWY